ncbi:MAG: ParA family protein [Polaromonas sp.]|uniref:ParA family protein n=1 Tax=Polaromonas sp. TaxID=1869339 RepID=UPI0025D70B60|nr:ParA family protein [Polaromonas sp.]MBI2726632.1 ParA family protein [Polaromonas sp.]
MPVIAVVNRKGGSGKSTLAAHIAAWCSRHGSSVMLGDVDRQQSARNWLKRRDASLPAIAPWAVDQKNMLRVPTGITHVVLDTPGGMHGFELARVVMFADAIVMPVCNSMFDRESAAACHAELMAMPRVASGRCKLVTIGMRIDGRTNASQTLRDWSENLGVPFLGALRETQLYVKSLERGMTIFDLPSQVAATDLQQWEPILEWLEQVLYPQQAANDAVVASAPLISPAHRPVEQSVRHSLTGLAVNAASATASRLRPGAPAASGGHQAVAAPAVKSSLPNSLVPAQESLVHGGRLSVHGSGRVGSSPVLASGKPAMTRNVNSQDGLQIPQFLKRTPLRSGQN